VSAEWVLDDNSSLWFGTSSDIEVRFDGTDMDILGDDLIVNIGSDGAGSDVNVYSETAGDYIFFDEDNAIAKFRDYSISLDDDADLSLGTDNDFVIDSDTAKTLDILPGAASDDYIVNFGLDQSGVDIKAFGATTGEYFQWDASNDTLSANTGNISWVTTDAEANQWKVDATGTIAGYAVVIETTAGGVQINADGATQGDIAIDAADDMTLTAAGDLTLAVTGTVSAGGSPITNQKMWIEDVSADDTITTAESGKVFYVTNDTDGITLTLPSVGASENGVYFTIYDANEVAASDVTIEPSDSDTIGGTADGWTSDGADEEASITLMYDHASTDWAVINVSSPTAGTWNPDS
jgi:hypothetical protein